MEIWDYIIEKDFSSLSLFDFDEIKEVIESFNCFVSDENLKQAKEEILKLSSEYRNEYKKIEDYEKTIFSKAIEYSEEKPLDDPSFMVGKLQGEIKKKMIDIIEKYFDLGTFIKYKDKLPHSKVEMTMLDEDKQELVKAMVSIRKWTYHFLNTIGIYYSTKHYFIKKKDVYKICGIYTNEVVYVNKLYGKNYYFNIFAPWGRLDYVKRGLIDVDNISVQSLVLPYLNSNTKILVSICEMIRKGFHNKRPWYDIKKEISVYIKECEKSNLLKKVE